MVRTLALALSALLLGSCATHQTCACAEDETALRASIRHEVLAELRSNALLAAQREPAQQEQAEPDEEPVERFRVDADRAPARGAGEPLVTIVMFSDFECPFCSRVEPTLTRLLAAHPDVRLVWRNNPLPFHQNALPAAEAAMEAYRQGGDAVFWRYHALLFENQRALSRADLERYGTQVGLDAGELARALDGHVHRAHIERDQALAARLQARGTPAFFINGRVLMGAQPYEAFDALVREELAAARRAMAGGVERRDLYAHFMHQAREAPSDEVEGGAVAGDLPRRPVPDPNAVYRVPIDGRPSHGPADALVTIVVFADFECPFCARVQPTLQEVADRYGRDVRFVFRHNPLSFHPNALPAALAAEEVFRQRGARGFFRYHDLLFENQRSLGRERLLDLARQAGADRRQVERALESERHRATVQADQDLAAQIGATGTPSFFINGRNLRGAQPLPAFQALIDEELVRARARVASGTPRSRVYEVTIANGATSPQTIDAPAPAAPPAPDTVYRIPIPRDARSRGPANARVTIQVFSDFQCPFCNRLGPTLDRLLEAYPRDVRIVFRDYPLPFHENAMPAAEAAREVFRQRGSADFWRYHDLLFENQQQLDTDTLVSLAAQVPGVRSAAVRRALQDGTHRAAVQADIQAITDANVRIGTPSSFINGRLIQGAQPYEAFRAAVERALAEP